MSKIDLSLLSEKLKELSSDGRSALLPALHLTQSLFGYIPETAAREIGMVLGVPLADIHGVIDFYDLFHHAPPTRHTLRICTDPACAMAGGETALEAVGKRYNIHPGESSSDGKVRLERSPCLGLCAHAPAMLLNQIPVGHFDPSQLDQLDEISKTNIKDHISGEPRILTARCGKETPTPIEQYLQSGGYQGLKRAMEIGPQEVIQTVIASGLVGRGGAAFPTGLKWDSAAKAEGEKRFVVCNADESEPGTYKDRILIEGDPHIILEGILITAYAVGASKAYIYVRGEYQQAYRVMSNALREAEQHGYLGKNISGSDFSLDVELRMGAGAYICGEETALFESIEGKRGFPRLKPPYPTTHGLFGQPTVINNVETLANVPHIIMEGAEGFRQQGTPKSPGTKLFCLSGDIQFPGVYEVPFGISLRELIYDLAGGIPEGRNLQAVLLGGAAGAFVSPKQIDIQLSFEALQGTGLSLGSGVVTIFDERRDLRATLYQLARFFAHESCGKCYPCQLGTQRQLEIIGRILQGKILPGDIKRLKDIGWTMTDASICGLGQTAATAILSAMQLWPQLFTSKAEERFL